MEQDLIPLDRHLFQDILKIWTKFEISKLLIRRHFSRLINDRNFTTMEKFYKLLDR